MSLRLRLALWYGTLTTGVVALVCGYAYAVHSRTHYDELDRIVHAVAASVSDSIASPKAVLASPLLLGASVWLVDDESHILAASGDTANRSPFPALVSQGAVADRPYRGAAAFVPALHRPDEAPGRFGIVHGRDGQRLRSYTERRRRAAADVVVLMPLTHIDEALSGFAWLIIAMGATGGSIAFVVGWLVAGRALRPVAYLTDAAADIAASGKFARRLATHDSRDELGRLSRTFNVMLASLEEAYQSQLRFVAAASHELRAPLTVVQANLDLLASGRMAREDRAVALSEASSETGRMSRLVGDLLALARADAGVGIRHERVELDRVVLRLLGEARHLTRGHHLEAMEIIPVVVEGDGDRLKQLFLIIVDNAIRYTPQEGRVAVSMRREAGQVLVVVRDTGVGISEADLPRVFDRFFRADVARSRDPGGSGLGLSIARWIVEEHGGSLTVESRAGEGTRVTVRLSVAPPATGR